MSHPNPHGEPNLTPITVGEVFENRVTRERNVILERFWDNPEGAEAILQLRAAVLSDDNRLQTFVLTRPGCATRRRQEGEYRQAA